MARSALRSTPACHPAARLHGTGTALRKHDWRFGRSTAEVRVLEPVETTGLTARGRPALKEQVGDHRGGPVRELAKLLER